MDDPATIERLAMRLRALCWVGGTDDLEAIVAASPVDLGEILHFTRGDRTWRLTVPSDGQLPWAGLLPAFIECCPGPHPSTAKQDLGVLSDKVQITHPDPKPCWQLLDRLHVGHLAELPKERLRSRSTWRHSMAQSYWTKGSPEPGCRANGAAAI